MESRGGANSLSLAAGATAAAWLSIWLRSSTISVPLSGAPGALVSATLLAALGAGSIASVFRDGDPASWGRALAPVLLAGIAMAITIALPHAGPVAPLALAAGGAAIGLLTASVPDRPAAFLGGSAAAVLAVGLLLPRFGVRDTAELVAGGTAVLGLGAALLARRRPEEPRPASGPAAPFSFLAGTLGASWALLLHRSVVAYTGDSIDARTVFLAVALFGSTIGASVAGKTRDRIPLLLVGGAAAVVATAALHGHLEWIAPGVVRRLGGIPSWPRALTLVAAESAALTLPAMACLGAILGNRQQGRSFRIGWAALGAATGLLATALLVRRAGADAALLLGVAIALVAANGAALGERRGPARLAVAVAALAILASAAWIRTGSRSAAPFEKRYGPLLYFSDSGPTTILVTDDPEQGRILRFGDGRTQGGTGTDPEDRTIAQIPMLLHPAPRRVLQVGFGVGNGASSILAHPIERLDVVDRTGAAAEIAPFFDETNLDVLSDDRLALHTDDPWAFLARTDQSWDLIRLSASSSEHADLEEIPTIERLRLARDHLGEGGGVAVDLNVGRASIDEIRSVLQTMAAVFEHVSVWNGPLGYSWVVYGTDREPPSALPALGERLRDADVEAELLSLDLGAPQAVLAHHVRSDAGVRALSGDAPPVTEDRPRLDDLSSRSDDTFFGLAGAVADTPLADLTAPGAENVGLKRLFENLQRNQALAEPAEGAAAAAP